MKKLLILLFFLPLFIPVYGQKQGILKIPLTPDKWEFETGKVEFTNTEGRQSMKLLPMSGKVIFKNLDFSVGTIEFDIQTKDKTFAFMYFRYQDANETESFYFRTAGGGKPYATDAVQYTPYIDGVNLWDIMGHYQAGADYKNGEWTHVKMEVSESQMRLFINNSTKPTLTVPKLEGNTRSGRIAFEGEMVISNITIRPGDVSGLSPLAGVDPTAHDPRFIRNWMVSKPFSTPEKVDFSYNFLPTDSTEWETIEAERLGLINLSRKFGKGESRRFAWLKVVLKAEKDQTRKIDLGFSDEVWVFLNGKMVYLDKNPYNQPMMKEPNGRISIENTSFQLDLKEGHNDLLIGVANDFYGWGIMARMDQLEGMDLILDSSLYYYGRKVAMLPDHIMDSYLGNYRQADGKAFTIAKEENAIKITADIFSSLIFYPEAEGRFFSKKFDLQMELIADKSQSVNLVKFYENGNEVLKLELIKE